MASYDNIEELAVTATGVLGQAARSSGRAVTGYASAQLKATAFSGTIQCQGSFDNGTTWVALQIVNLADGTTGTGITAAGLYRVDVGGVPRYRWNCTSFSSATSAYLYPTVRVG